MIDDLNGYTYAALGLAGVLGLIVSWMRWLRPRYRNTRADGIAIRDAILGRDAVMDSITGKELAPPLPGIGQRMAHQEQQMSEMTRAVTQLAETHAQMAEVRREVSVLSTRVGKLEEGAAERILSTGERIAMFRVMEEAVKATPDLEAEAQETDDA